MFCLKEEVRPLLPFFFARTDPFSPPLKKYVPPLSLSALPAHLLTPPSSAPRSSTLTAGPSKLSPLSSTLTSCTSASSSLLYPHFSRLCLVPSYPALPPPGLTRLRRILIDVGTKPGPKSLYFLWKAFDLNSNIAGAAGEICAMKGKAWMGLLNPLVAAQNFVSAVPVGVRSQLMVSWVRRSTRCRGRLSLLILESRSSFLARRYPR